MESKLFQGVQTWAAQLAAVMHVLDQPRVKMWRSIFQAHNVSKQREDMLPDAQPWVLSERMTAERCAQLLKLKYFRRLLGKALAALLALLHLLVGFLHGEGSERASGTPLLGAPSMEAPRYNQNSLKSNFPFIFCILF